MRGWIQAKVVSAAYFSQEILTREQMKISVRALRRAALLRRQRGGQS